MEGSWGFSRNLSHLGVLTRRGPRVGMGKKGKMIRMRRPMRKRKIPTGGLSEAITVKLGEANLLYATSAYEKAITLLKEVRV